MEWSREDVIYSTLVSRKDKCPTIKESIVHFATRCFCALWRRVWMASLVVCHSASPASCPVRLHHHLMMFPAGASQLVQEQFCRLTLVRTGSSQKQNGVFPHSLNSQKKIHCASKQAFERSEIGQELTASKLVNTHHPTRIKLNLIKRPGMTVY